MRNELTARSRSTTADVIAVGLVAEAAASSLQTAGNSRWPAPLRACPAPFRAGYAAVKAMVQFHQAGAGGYAPGVPWASSQAAVAVGGTEVLVAAGLALIRPVLD